MSNINDIIQVKTSDFKVVIKKTKIVKRREASQMMGNLWGNYWKIENWLQVKVTSYFRLNFHSRLTFGLASRYLVTLKRPITTNGTSRPIGS